MIKPLSVKVRHEILRRLRSLYEDCAMAIDGSWEVSPEGFEAMQESIRRCIALLGGDPPTYTKEGSLTMPTPTDHLRRKRTLTTEARAEEGT